MNISFGKLFLGPFQILVSNSAQSVHKCKSAAVLEHEKDSIEQLETGNAGMEKTDS